MSDIPEAFDAPPQFFFFTTLRLTLSGGKIEKGFYHIFDLFRRFVGVLSGKYQPRPGREK